MYVKNLTFQHQKDAPYFFKDLSFELEEGRLHALHGKNGIGKSILLHILSRNSGQEAVISGEISEDNIALMNQQFDQTLVSSFSFLENLKFCSFSKFPKLFSRCSSPTLSDEILRYTEKFHIDPSLPVHKLSGGQRQILTLLMKLQKKPRILLLDEPTAALDVSNARMVFDFLSSLKDVTLLVVCHDQDLIQQYTTGKHLYIEVTSNGVRDLKHQIPPRP